MLDPNYLDITKPLGGLSFVVDRGMNSEAHKCRFMKAILRLVVIRSCLDDISQMQSNLFSVATP